MECNRCKRPLQNPQSIERHMGAICFSKNRRVSNNTLFAPDQVIDLPFKGDVVCWRDASGQKHFNVPQSVVLHSPTGMEWGYGGSGPADFSLNILLLYTDKETARRFHQDFKFRFVGVLPREGGTIPGDDIKRFIQERKAEENKKVGLIIHDRT